MKTVTIKNISDLIEDEFGAAWWDNPYCLRLFAVQAAIFEEEAIKCDCPIMTIDACLEFKRSGTVNGKPINEDMNRSAFEKLMQQEEYEI